MRFNGFCRDWLKSSSKQEKTLKPCGFQGSYNGGEGSLPFITSHFLKERIYAIIPNVFLIDIVSKNSEFVKFITPLTPNIHPTVFLPTPR